MLWRAAAYLARRPTPPYHFVTGFTAEIPAPSWRLRPAPILFAVWRAIYFAHPWSTLRCSAGIADGRTRLPGQHRLDWRRFGIDHRTS
ncbi:MAG: hypothetical protein ACLTYW_04325 [Collinsella sp.]